MIREKKIAIIITTIIVVITISIVVIFKILFGQLSRTTVEMSGDITPTISMVIEDRRASEFKTNTSSEISSNELLYNDVEDVQGDLEKYINYLRDKEGFLVTKDLDLSYTSGSLEFAKNSVDSNMVIIVSIEYTNTKYKITYIKTYGRLEIY